MLATRLAKERGCDDALLVTPHGRVLEAPTCSFFYSLGAERLYTPPLSDHILDSITRRHVIAVTGAQERATARDDLEAVTEAFLASTLREVHPVARIEERELVAPGPLTRAAGDGVAQRIRELLP
jgi:branched-chain amino acid aminotransferase